MEIFLHGCCKKVEEPEGQAYMVFPLYSLEVHDLVLWLYNLCWRICGYLLSTLGLESQNADVEVQQGDSFNHRFSWKYDRSTCFNSQLV